MAEKKIYIPEFRHLVVKSYFNSFQSATSTGKQFKVPTATICFWTGRYKDEFSKEKNNIQNLLIFKAEKRKQTPMKKKNLLQKKWRSGFWNWNNA